MSCRRRDCISTARNCVCLDLPMSLKSREVCLFRWNTSMGSKASGSTMLFNCVPRPFAWKKDYRARLLSLTATSSMPGRAGGYRWISAQNYGKRRGRDGAASSPARKERIPLVKIDDVAVMGEVTLTASALHLLLERNIEINFLSHYGKFKGRLSPPFSKNALLRLAQYRAHMDMVKRCELARRFVIGKLSNQRQRLQRYNRSQSDPEVSQVIGRLADLLGQLAALPVDKAETGKALVSGDQGIVGTPLETI